MKILFLLLLIPAHGYAQQASPLEVQHPSLAESTFAARVAGCYEISTRAIVSDRGIARFTRLPAGPIRFALTTRAAAGTQEVAAHDRTFYFAVDTDSLPAHGRDLFRSWILLPGVTTRALVSVPLPMAGVSLVVAPRGRDLVGVLQAFTDALPPDGPSSASHAIVARRIACTRIHRVDS